MDTNVTELFLSLNEALKYVGSASGLYINQTSAVPHKQSFWSLILNAIPLLLGFIGLVFNILALLIFTVSKTFRESSFRCYIYAFVLANCASILSHSWLYLVFYIIIPIHFCKYVQYLQQSLSTTSLWIMILLSFERSLTFARPLTVKTVLKFRTVVLILVILTVLCFAVHIDEIISAEIKAFRWVNFAYGICSIKRYSRLTTDRIKILTHSHSFILPFLLNSILDIYICFNICRRRKRLFKQASSISLSNKSRRLKFSLANEITLTLLCQSMWLLLTHFPRHLYYSLISFKLINDYDRDNSTLIFIIRQNLLIYLAFSPTLYVILSPTLRKEIYFHLGQSHNKNRRSSSLCVLRESQRIKNSININQSSQHQKPYFSSLIAKTEELPQQYLTTSSRIP